MSDLTIVAPNHRLDAYVSVPDGTGPWPGVVVLHDSLGQTRDSRRYADWLAASGYLAIAPDLYSWGNKLLCIRAVTRDLLARTGAAFEDIEAARSYIQSRDDCTGAMGVIGFCLGGGFALLTAANGGGFSASSVNYGIVPRDAEDLLGGACPLVGSFGGRDYTLRGAAARLESALTTQGVPHDVKEYAEVGHGFLNDHEGALGWAMARVAMRFDQAASEDARARIIDFFGRHLR